MKRLHIGFLLFFLFINTKSLYADVKIVYLDLDFILQNSLAGQYLVNEIENKHKNSKVERI